MTASRTGSGVHTEGARAGGLRAVVAAASAARGPIPALTPDL